MVNVQAFELRKLIPELEAQLKQARQALEAIEARCSHSWGPVQYDPIEHAAYHIPGDPPEFSGADHRFPMDVPARTEKRWRRDCIHCGKPEYTNHTKPAGEEPVF
ncbi:MAG: hypothetical protein WCV85_00765 [Patescibacteria group bacterium]|jgi:hypothetical protein